MTILLFVSIYWVSRRRQQEACRQRQLQQMADRLEFDIYFAESQQRLRGFYRRSALL